MQDNGNQGKPATDATLVSSVMRALEDPRYEWRTIEGVCQQTDLPPDKVREILESSSDIVRSSVPDELGRSLYTTRKHYRQTHGLGARFLSALSDKVA